MDPSARSPALRTYYKSKRYLNVLRYVSLINQKGRDPSYPQLVAYQLYKDEATGKWRIPEEMKTFLKQMPAP